MKSCVIPFVLAVAVLPGWLEAQSAPAEARIDAVVRAAMERQKIPGTAVAVIHKHASSAKPTSSPTAPADTVSSAAN